MHERELMLISHGGCDQCQQSWYPIKTGADYLTRKQILHAKQFCTAWTRQRKPWEKAAQEAMSQMNLPVHHAMIAARNWPLKAPHSVKRQLLLNRR